MGDIQTWVNIIISIITSGVVAKTVFGFGKEMISERLKNGIKNEYDQKLVSFKAELDSKNTSELERFKAELQIKSTEHQIRYSRLHEKTAESISKTYEQLVLFMDAVSDYIKSFEPAGSSSKDERLEKVADAYDNFRDSFRPNKIFFPPKLAKQVEELIYSNRNIVLDFKHKVHIQEDDNYSKTKDWAEIESKFNSETRDLLVNLENEFRKLLGMKNEDLD